MFPALGLNKICTFNPGDRVLDTLELIFCIFIFCFECALIKFTVETDPLKSISSMVSSRLFSIFSFIKLISSGLIPKLILSPIFILLLILV